MKGYLVRVGIDTISLLSYGRDKKDNLGYCAPVFDDGDRPRFEFIPVSENPQYLSEEEKKYSNEPARNSKYGAYVSSFLDTEERTLSNGARCKTAELQLHKDPEFDSCTYGDYFGGRIPLRLRPGSKLFLYESQGNKEIVGEARINRVESVRASDAVAKYGARLFLTQLEFEEYVGNRGDKTMLALVLGDVRIYAVPLSLNKSVTMAGRYMTREMYLQLREESRKSIKIEARA